jgi:outer membrane protein OmpA-like peptidoglycan-associated protein
MTSVRLLPALLAAAVAAATSACVARKVATPAQPGAALVVLLPEADPTHAGGAIVSNSAGTVELDEPFEATTVTAARAPAPAAKMSEGEVTREFGSVFANLPAAPQSFLLYFRTDSSELTAESQALLPAVLRAVADRLVPDVTVIGHTDTTGRAASNYRLGLKRAVTVRALLVSTGVDGALIQIESHGEADLLAKTADNTPEARNRRVEITVK